MGMLNDTGQRGAEDAHHAGAGACTQRAESSRCLSPTTLTGCAIWQELEAFKCVPACQDCSNKHGWMTGTVSHLLLPCLLTALTALRTV